MKFKIVSISMLACVIGCQALAWAESVENRPGNLLVAKEETKMESLPPGVYMATFANGYRMRSDAEFVGDSWNTEGHTATAGELAAQGFDYTESGGAFVNSPIDDRAYVLKKQE